MEGGRHQAGSMGSIRIIGIDPGVNGAIAVLDSENPRHVRITDLPTTKRHNGRTRLDGAGMLDILRQMTGRRLTFIGCEAVHAMPVSGSIGVFSQGSVTGSLEAIFDILQTEKPSAQVIYVTPAKWKRHFGLLKKKKEDSRQKAIALFGNIDQLLRKRDHDRAEAALIALYTYHDVQGRIYTESGSH